MYTCNHTINEKFQKIPCMILVNPRKNAIENVNSFISADITTKRSVSTGAAVLNIAMRRSEKAAIERSTRSLYVVVVVVDCAAASKRSLSRPSARRSIMSQLLIAVSPRAYAGSRNSRSQLRTTVHDEHVQRAAGLIVITATHCMPSFNSLSAKYLFIFCPVLN